MDSPAKQDQPSDVVAALAAITARLGPIEKLTPAERRKRGMGGGDGERGITYAYRGVDQIAAELQPLLGEYGVVIVPRVASHDVEHIEVGQKPWTSHTVMIHWDIYGPGGLTDRLEATTIGEGRDNSDKGVNKATTAAYKNLLLRMFSIGDPNEDPDTERHETTVAVDPNVAAATVVYEQLRDAVAADSNLPDRLRQLGDEHGRQFTEAELRDPVWRGTVAAFLDRHTADAEWGDGEALADALDLGGA